MEKPEVSCSFCEQPYSKVKKMIAGPNGIYICNYCAALSYQVMVKEGVDMALSDEPRAGSNPIRSQTNAGQ